MANESQDTTQLTKLAAGDASKILDAGGRSIEEERLHRKQRLAGSFRLFSKFGFDEGVAGHITARDPELTDHFWVNPFGMHFGHIRVSDLMLVRHDGKIVEGDRPLNQAAFAIHSEIHAARPDVIGAAHSHSVYGKTWSTQSHKTRARSTTITHSSMITRELCSTPKRASALLTHLAIAKPRFFATMVCLLSAIALKKPCGGSSRWNAHAKRNSWPKQRARQ
jgi:Class II Aldolase and Adducin N-terminal domain